MEVVKDREQDLPFLIARHFTQNHKF